MRIDCLSNRDDDVILHIGAIGAIGAMDGGDDEGHGDECDAAEGLERKGTGRKEGEGEGDGARIGYERGREGVGDEEEEDEEDEEEGGKVVEWGREWGWDVIEEVCIEFNVDIGLNGITPGIPVIPLIPDKIAGFECWRYDDVYRDVIEGWEALAELKVPVRWWHVLSSCCERHTATLSRRITLCVALLGSSPVISCYVIKSD